MRDMVLESSDVNRMIVLGELDGELQGEENLFPVALQPIYEKIQASLGLASSLFWEFRYLQLDLHSANMLLDDRGKPKAFDWDFATFGAETALDFPKVAEYSGIFTKRGEGTEDYLELFLRGDARKQQGRNAGILEKFVREGSSGLAERSAVIMERYDEILEKILPSRKDPLQPGYSNDAQPVDRKFRSYHELMFYAADMYRWNEEIPFDGYKKADKDVAKKWKKFFGLPAAAELAMLEFFDRDIRTAVKRKKDELSTDGLDAEEIRRVRAFFLYVFDRMASN